MPFWQQYMFERVEAVLGECSSVALLLWTRCVSGNKWFILIITKLFSIIYKRFSILSIVSIVVFACKWLLFNDIYGFKGSEISKFKTNPYKWPFFLIYFNGRV